MDLLQRWVARQFTTRVIVMMPVAIAINIVLGYTVQSGLKLPIYVDSIGTILVGVLGGPLPGMITGILSNLIWQYAPGIGSGSQIGPFAITAGIIGLLAGVWGQLGFFRPRRGRALNIAAALDPTLVRTEAVTVDVELGGRLTTGETVTDWRRVWGRPPNVEVAVEVDSARFMARFIERVGDLAARLG